MEILGIYEFSDALKLIKQDTTHLAMKSSNWDDCYIKIVMPSDNEYEAYLALYTADGSVPYILQYSEILCGTWEVLKLDIMGEETSDPVPEEEEEDYGNPEESETDDEPEEIAGFGLVFEVAVKMLSHLRDDGFVTTALKRKGWNDPGRYIAFNMSDPDDENLYTEIGTPYCATRTDIVSSDWYLISL